MDNADRADDYIEQRLQEALALRQAAAHSRRMTGPALCEDCAEPIPAPRRAHLPGVATCVECQAIREQQRRGWR